MTTIIRYLVVHPTAAKIILVLVLTAAILAAPRVRTQAFPDVPVGTVSVSYTWTGAGASDMDSAIVARIEPRLRSIVGARRTMALSQDGYCNITIELDPGRDLAAAVADVEAALRRVREIPDAVEGPIIKRGEWRDGVVDLVLSGEVPPMVMAAVAHDLRTRLQGLGVTATEIKGLPEAEISVEVRPGMLERYGLSISDVASAIRSETGTKAIGEAGSENVRIRAGTRALVPDEISRIAVRAEPDGTHLRVGDLATISTADWSRGEVLQRDGRPAVLIAVERSAGGDTIAIRRAVDRLVREIEPSLASGLKLETANARDETISGLMNVLVGNAVGGIAFVIVVLMLVFRRGTTIAVAFGIVTATAATIALTWLFGHTFNLISLFALILCLGIVVDDSIVVAENAEKKLKQGMTAEDAAVLGTSEMAGPIVASALTTILAFGSLALIDGRFGSLISDLPFTVAIILAASLLDTCFILPAHLAHAFARGTAGARSTWLDRRLDVFRERCFIPLARCVISQRYLILSAALLAVAQAASVVLEGTVPWRFFDAPERSEVRLNITMLPGTRRAETIAMVREAERALYVTAQRYERRYGRNPVRLALATIGGLVGVATSGSEGKSQDQLAGISVELIPSELRSYGISPFIEDWRSEMKALPRVEGVAWRRTRAGPSGQSLSVRLSGGDPKTLKLAVENLVNELSREPAARDVVSSLVYGLPELVVVPNPRGNSLGFTSETIATDLRSRLDGIDAARGRNDGADIVVRVRAEPVPGAAIEDLVVKSAWGVAVRLDEIASVKREAGLASIRREGGVQHATVSGEVTEDPKPAAELLRRLRNEIMPRLARTYGVDWALGELAEEEDAFVTRAALSLALTLTTIMMTLAWTFGSWSLAVVVMLAIPFGFVGAVLGHWIHGLPISLLSLVGGIGLCGIIVNGAIVLVQAFAERSDTDIHQRIANASGSRLRAVLLTTATAVGGSVPLLLETSRHVLILKPALATMTWGLGVGTLIVLLILPAMLAVLEDVRRLARTLVRKVPPGFSEINTT